MSTRVLVIEDNQANLDLITYLLEAFGYAVSAARDGRHGLAAAKREHPDLILCDIQLPEMDGFEVLERLKRDSELCAIKTVAMTAYAMVGDREKLMAAGFDGYLSKPINPESFLDELKAFAAQPEAGTTRAAAAAAAVPATPSAPKAGTVLFVDDATANAELVHTLLAPSGYHVVFARTVAEGERLALERRPDLILSDLHIGAESGYDFLARVRRHPALATTPFVFVSSTAMRLGQHTRRARELGAADFIQRPIEPQEFLARVKACMQAKSPWRPS